MVSSIAYGQMDAREDGHRLYQLWVAAYNEWVIEKVRNFSKPHLGFTITETSMSRDGTVGYYRFTTGDGYNCKTEYVTFVCQDPSGRDVIMYMRKRPWTKQRAR